MNVLLSIKPEFAEKILEGAKSYEFRKRVFSDATKVDNIFMYASTPTREIVGGFTIEDIIEDHPTMLWERFGDESGIKKRSRFLEYFAENEIGYAMGIDRVFEFNESVDPNQEMGEFSPPVSFCYLDGELDSALVQRVPKSVQNAKSINLKNFASD